MSRPQVPRPHEAPNTGAEKVPPGATREAFDRPVTPPRGDPNEDAVGGRTIDDPRKGERGDGLPADRMEGEVVREPTRRQVEAWKGPVLLEFGSEGCPHCMAVRPLLRALLAEFPQVRHVRVEDGKGKPLGRSFGVKLWPTLVFLQDGRVVRQMSRPEAAEVRRGFEAVGAGEG
jgi:thioredoxin 1